MIKINNIYEWSPFKQLILQAILFVIVFYLGLLFDIYDLKDELLRAKQQETNLKLTLDNSMDKVMSGLNEIATYKNYNAELKEWQNSLVAYKNLPEIFNDILKEGASNNVQFVLFAPEQKIEVTGQYVEVPVKVIIVGGYQQIATFFSQIANFKNTISIGKFVISNENKPDILGPDLAKKATAENSLTAELMLAIFYMDTNILPKENPKPNQNKPPTVPNKTTEMKKT